MNTNFIPISSSSAKYWSELKDLSDDVKLELITLLSSSMVHNRPNEANANWADRFVGVWKDDRSTEEIVDDIRSMRTANQIDIEL